MFAVTRNKKWLTSSLRVVGAIFLAALVVTSAVTSAQADTVSACLVHIIDTSQWSPPSPDPAGITYLPPPWSASGHLLISDSEVDEMPPYFKGVNVFEAL